MVPTEMPLQLQSGVTPRPGHPSVKALPVTIVAAMDENRVIGRGGGMPWHLPADLVRFRALTMGKPIIMGRLTHDSLGRVLDGRHNIVLSRQRGFRTPDFRVRDLTIVHSLEDAFGRAREVASDDAKEVAQEVAVIGGASIYEQVISVADRIHLTIVHASIDGDARFPELDPESWREVSRAERGADERNGYDLSFIELVRQPFGPADAPEDDPRTVPAG